MWRVDDCFIHSCVFRYWMFRSDMSVIPFRMCLFFIIILALSLWIFDLSLPVGDKFFWSDYKWNCQLALGLDRIFKQSYDYLF